MAKPSTVSNSIPITVNARVKEEHGAVASTSVSLRSIPSQQFPMKPVKGEQDDVTNGQLPLVVSSVSSAYEDNNRAAEIAKSVNELGNFAVAINAFTSLFDELQKHVDFIDKAIDARSEELALLSNTTQNTATVSCTPLAGGNVQSTEPVNTQPTLVKENELHSNQKLKAKTENGEGDGSLNDVVSICRTMCSRGLRKYIVSNLSQPEKLREQVPAALKSAPKPSKLVFECIGRFFLQGSRAYNKDSPMIPARLASILVLEYYLLSGCTDNEKDINHSLKEEASLAATAWKKRLIVEGGVSKACEIDARGLILFVGGFGIPASFRHEEIRDLIRLSNPREIMHALRQSRGLLKKVSDIADGLMKKGMVAEAVDLAYIFGFEEKLSPQTNLTSYLQKSEDSWKKTKQETCGSATALKQADEKYLAALRSVVNCLEGHKIDHAEFLPGSKLKEKISNLEKDIDDANKKIQDMVVSKRKMDKNDSSNKLKAPESKRSRLNVKDPSLVSFLQEQRISSNMDGNNLYDVSLTAHMLSSRPSSHLNNYPAATSVQLGSAAGPLLDSVFGGTLAGGGKLIGAGIGGTAGSFSGYHGDKVVDNVGTMLNTNDHLYRQLGIRESVLSHERLVGRPVSARVSSLYGVSPSVESFAGLQDHPSLSSAGRIGASDLYSFADAIYEGGSFQASSSAKATNVPPILPGRSSSYMY
ncbi:protein FRIGIDA [Prosopis cineraria]|uniref:protein FRIGIDA n=1 Tax=Prosopis cineraria TaxID=364024 RepID=UPI00240FBF7C|nr:protein FRIGIDA [Prosopis cineraria]